MTWDEALKKAAGDAAMINTPRNPDEARMAWAAAFLSSLAASGYAVVPVEATKKMIYSATVRPAPREDETMYSSIWRAMLAAAQEDSHD